MQIFTDHAALDMFLRRLRPLLHLAALGRIRLRLAAGNLRCPEQPRHLLEEIPPRKEHALPFAKASLPPCAWGVSYRGRIRGRNSVVECSLPKADVVGSNPIARY